MGSGCFTRLACLFFGVERIDLTEPQGPEAAQILQNHVKEDLNQLYFGSSGYYDVAGVKCHVARGGYTGEDGFEVREYYREDQVLLKNVLRSPFRRGRQLRSPNC